MLEEFITPSFFDREAWLTSIAVCSAKGWDGSAESCAFREVSVGSRGKQPFSQILLTLWRLSKH